MCVSDYTKQEKLLNNDEITSFHLEEEMKEIEKLPQKIKYKPLPEDDPLQRNPDISLAKKILGWKPVIPRSEGLRKTYEYYEKNFKAGTEMKKHKTFKEYIHK